MIQIFLLSALIALLVALAGTYIAMKIQSRSLTKLHVQQEAWQRAQDAQLRTWEVRQGNHALDIEKKLAGQVKQVQDNWQTWEIRDQERFAHMAQEFEALMGKLNLEHELTRLPRIDELPLPSSNEDQRQPQLKNWRPPTFYGADLTGHDLSHRYLVQADFREAQLRGANFYMADLRNACLASADLTDADLSGADLSGADLRSAVLKGANFLVTDMHNAILNGANLRGARNLTADQAYSALFDNTTQFDESADVTMPRIPSIRLTVYTESTPLVSLRSSEDVKRLESPENSVEASPVISLSETTEKQTAVSEVPSDVPDTLLLLSTIQDEMSEPADQPQSTIQEDTHSLEALATAALPTVIEDAATEEDIHSLEALAAAAFPAAFEEAAIETIDTTPHQAVPLNGHADHSDVHATEETEIVSFQPDTLADFSSNPEEPVIDETPVVQSAPLSSSDVTDIPAWSYEDTFEPVIPHFSTAETFVDQLQTVNDAEWANSEEAEHANGNGNGHSANHYQTGNATNGTNGHAVQASELDLFTEQQVEDTPLLPPPSNDSSPAPMESSPQSDTPENRRTGGSGKAIPSRGKSDKRRARAN